MTALTSGSSPSRPRAGAGTGMSATSRLLVLLVSLPLLCACSTGDRVDLVVTDARVLDVDTGKVIPDQTVVISNGNNTAVREGEGEPPGADRLQDLTVRPVAEPYLTIRPPSSGPPWRS